MAKTKRIKVVRVPGTTNNITKGIISFLTFNGHYAFRVNTKGTYDPRKKQYIRDGAEKGVSDIICFLNAQNVTGYVCDSSRPVAIVLCIEVKNEQTKDRMRKAQDTFAEKVRAVNGRHIVATSYDNFVRWFHHNYCD